MYWYSHCKNFSFCRAVKHNSTMNGFSDSIAKKENEKKTLRRNYDKTLKSDYYQQNREDILMRKKKYYLENKERVKNLKTEYYRENKQEIMSTRKKQNEKFIFNQGEFKPVETSRDSRRARLYYQKNTEKIQFKKKQKLQTRNPDRSLAKLMYAHYHNKEIAKKKRLYTVKRREKILLDFEDPNYLGPLKEEAELFFSVKSPRDWYNFSTSQLQSLPKFGPIFRYVGILDFLKSIYPSLHWERKEFVSFFGKQNFWTDKRNVRHFLINLYNLFGLGKLEDWYYVSRRQIEEIENGREFLGTFKRLYHGLKFAFPEFPWNSEKFAFKGKKSMERFVTCDCPKYCHFFQSFESPRSSSSIPPLHPLPSG
eukprot:TRINITY_DN27318_c0_g1_i1.p1 TRINITY_DN27318_c0_g1~~TRINITY_DN27318_c0_g1_i1.p1  ORF type:complete len:367 (-),score=82.23 TRINITY_DN27318_c0_g1_i1:411-1511(-)